MHACDTNLQASTNHHIMMWHILVTLSEQLYHPDFGPAQVTVHEVELWGMHTWCYCGVSVYSITWYDCVFWVCLCMGSLIQCIKKTRIPNAHNHIHRHKSRIAETNQCNSRFTSLKCPKLVTGQNVFHHHLFTWVSFNFNYKIWNKMHTVRFIDIVKYSLSLVQIIVYYTTNS